MSQVAVKISRPNLILVEGEYHQPKGCQTQDATPGRQMLLLATIMIALQIVDGVLTGIGISHLGISAEGNILLRMMMENIGYIPTLVLVKTLAVFVVAALYFISLRVPWVAKAMRFMIAIYLGAAIIPWSAIILIKII